MKVGELIGLLIHMDQEAQVLVWDHDPGEGWFRSVIHEVVETPSMENEDIKEVLIV